MSEADPLDPLDLAIRQLDELVQSFEDEPEPTIRERAITLLQAVDGVHRPGLTRLAAYLDAAGPGLRDRAFTDPAIRLLFELYDLLPPEPARPPGFVPLSEIRVRRASGTGP